MDNQSHIAPQARPQTKPLRDLQDRVYELETYVRAAGSRPSSLDLYLGMGHPAGPGAASGKNDLQEKERSLLRGKGFKTQYFGPSHGASLLLQFEELSRFVKDIIQRLPTLEKHRNIWKHQRNELNTNLMLPDKDTLLSLLP